MRNGDIEIGEDWGRLFERLSSKSMDLSESFQTVVRDSAVVRWVCCERRKRSPRATDGAGSGSVLVRTLARMRRKLSMTVLTSRTDSGDKPSMTKIAVAGTDDFSFV